MPLLTSTATPTDNPLRRLESEELPKGKPRISLVCSTAMRSVASSPRPRPSTGRSWRQRSSLGLRVMELLGLCWRSVNLEEGVVHVRYQLTRDPALDARSQSAAAFGGALPFTLPEIDAIAAELGPPYGPLVVVAAETGLRTNEWAALERRDVDQVGRAVWSNAALPTASLPPTRRPFGPGGGCR